MDCFVHEIPLDHSFQKERRSLASKGSLGKRRRPSRYDIRYSVNHSFNLGCEKKESQEFSENCAKGSSENNFKHDDSASSISKDAKDQVKRKREPSKSAVLIQTWERRSQAEKAHKLQSTLPYSRDAKPIYNAAITAEKESDLRPPLQERRMLESPFVANHCSSRFHHGTAEEQEFLYGEYSPKEPRKWRPEPDFKSRNRTHEITGNTGEEPEWISLSKKLCAKFIESHFEPKSSDDNRNHQEVNHVSHAKSNAAEQNVSHTTSKKTESSGCKEPQWVLLSKKLCTKFLEEHIENLKEPLSPESSQDFHREPVVTEKFSKTAINVGHIPQRDEPEWISLSRKLRAKFIEGHLDDPDKVSFDSQLNASDLEESFSVPTLAQKYLDYRNQAHASYQPAPVKQEGGSNQNLFRECSTVNQVSKSLTGWNKELSRSLPDMMVKSQMQTEEFRGMRCEKKSLKHGSDLEYDPDTKNRDPFSNKEAGRVNVNSEGFSEYRLPPVNTPINISTNVSVSVTNCKHTSSPENQQYSSVCLVGERRSAKQIYDSEDSISTNGNEAKNSNHSFCSPPDHESRDRFHQNEHISLDNTAFRTRRNTPILDAEGTAARSPLGNNSYLKQCYSDDDDTFHTVDLNSNSDSIDSLEVKKNKDNEQYMNYPACEFNESNNCSTISYSRATNISESDCFENNSNTANFDNHASSPTKNVINSQQRNEFQVFDVHEERKRDEHLTSLTRHTFTDSLYEEESPVENNNKLWRRQSENGAHQVHHLKLSSKVEGSHNKSLHSSTAQFLHHGRERRSSASEHGVKCASDIELRGTEECSSHEAHEKNQLLQSDQCAVQSTLVINENECKVNAEILRIDCRNQNNEFTSGIERHHRTENGHHCIGGDSPEDTFNHSGASKTPDSKEDLRKWENHDLFREDSTSDKGNNQKVIVSFTVKPHETKGVLDVPCAYSFSDEAIQLPNDINTTVTNKNTNQDAGLNSHLNKIQIKANQSKTSANRVFKYGNFDKLTLKESAVFYRLCEDETAKKEQESEHRQNFTTTSLSESSYPNENTRITKYSSGADINSGRLNHSSGQPVMTPDDVNIGMVEEVKLKSSDKQRDVKTRLRPLGYLSKISNSNQSISSSDRPLAKRTDSTKSHYIDYKDEHLYMNYNHEYGKIRSKDTYHQNKCHASAPDLSKDIKKEDDVNQENLTICKAESHQEIKMEKPARSVLSLDCIIKMARSPGLTEPPDPSESVSINPVVTSKESFSQTSPIISAKCHNGEGGFCTFDDQDYLKDSTSTSFCPSDSECSSWIMTRNNSYVINESSSMNESDISDCSLSVKCDYLSSCSNQNTMETRGRSSSESGSYMHMQNLSKGKNFLQNAVERPELTTMSSEAGEKTQIQKPSCPATPESLRHLFQLPTKPLFPPTLHTSRVFISKEPPPIYASLSQSSSSSFKQDKTEERGRKTDRSSSLKIRDIAQGIILTFRRFQNISSTKHRHVSPSRYVDVSHLAESNRQVPKEWFSTGNNPSLNFLNGSSKKATAHSIFSASRPARSQSESSGCNVNFRRQQNINSRGEKLNPNKKSCSRSSSDISGHHERTKNSDTLQTNVPDRRTKNKNGDKVSDRRTKKSNKNRPQQNCSKNRTTRRPESRNVTSISRKVQQMADGTLYLVTTVSGDSSVPGFYSDSVNTSEGNSSCGRQTKATGESNC